MIDRRRLIAGALALPLAGLARPALARTPACGARTAEQTEGPYYTPKTPKRTSLVEPGAKAPRLVVEGRVLSTSCAPVAGALLDFWHCDERGVYDNEGFRYRGHLFTDAKGAFRLETILPAAYPGRTRHIHVKAQAPGRAMLTTQLYFPGEAANARDGIWEKALEMAMAERDGVKVGRFDFVIEV